KVDIGRSRAMVAKPRDGAKLEVAQTLKAPVGPAPIADVRALRRHAFPQNRIAQRLEAKAREGVEVVLARLMTAEDGLVAERLTDTVHRAFVSAPQFQCPHYCTLARVQRLIEREV